MTVRKLLIAAVVVASMSQAVWAADATADFSITNGNPNGAWSYGYTTTLGGSFSAYLQAATATAVSPQSGSFEAWSNLTPFADVPWVAKAGASGWACCNSVTVAANTLTMHPGANGEFSVVRFTSTTGGMYQVNASFFGQDYAGLANIGTTTDVHVRTAADVFTNTVVGFGTTVSYGGVVTLAAGGTLDFVVGIGAGLGNYNNYYNDSTGLTASVSVVPEPEGVVLALAGLAVAAAGRRRKSA
jgi:MYXO-CTERM domain-containing protein